MHQDILDRLRIDSGQRTLGQSLQDREAAAQGIVRLRSQVDGPRTVNATRSPDRKLKAPRAIPADASKKLAFRPGTLIRVADVCELLGVSLTTVWRWRSQQNFPKP